MDIQTLFSVKGKAVLITGATKGIGSYIAETFVTNGCKVYVTSRNADALPEICNRLNPMGPGTCTGIQVDINDEAQVQGLATKISDMSPEGLHILVNNASKHPNIAPIGEQPIGEFKGCLSTNLGAPFDVIQAMLPSLRKSARADDPARIINVSSVAGAHMFPLEYYSYYSSKAGLEHLTRALAYNLAKYNVTANTIVLGTMNSPIVERFKEKFGLKESVIPLSRFGTPQDIGGACIYLTSKAGSFVTGSRVVVDGGVMVKPATFSTVPENSTL